MERRAINYNTPRRIYFTDGSQTRYVYSAAGEKLLVEHYVAAPNVTVPFGAEPDALTQGQVMYAGSTQYLLGGSLVVKDGMVDRYLFEGGYAKALRVSPNSYRFAFHYYNQNHLGNNREVVDASGTVQQVTNYYPYGAPYTAPEAVMNANMQPYKYNGKELDRMHGLDTYDYGARQYDPVLGRWDRMDPLCEKYYDISPYVYCNNNPIIRIDRDGMIWETIWDAGNVIYDLGAATYHHFMGHKDEVKRSHRDAKWDTLAMVAPGVPAGASKVTKLLNFAGTAVHANSRTSSKAQHVYRIFEQSSNETVKVGISSGRIARNGKSYRANRQVNSWNKAVSKI